LLLGELEEFRGIASSLLRRSDGDAVNEHVIRPFLQHNQSGGLIMLFEQPHFPTPYPRSIVFGSRFGDLPDHSLIRGNIRLGADLLNDIEIG
jgi:hypothetical protein